jgi:hypothetical protein
MLAGIYILKQGEYFQLNKNASPVTQGEGFAIQSDGWAIYRPNG